MNHGGPRPVFTGNVNLARRVIVKIGPFGLSYYMTTDPVAVPLRGMTLGKKEVVVMPPTSASAKISQRVAAPIHGESALHPGPRVASHKRILPPFWRHLRCSQPWPSEW